MYRYLLLFFFFAGSPPTLAAQWGTPEGISEPLRVRLWVEGDRDFRNPEPRRVHFETTGDAYVAVVHIDTEGRLEFLFPQRPWGDDWVEGWRTYSLPARGAYGDRFPEPGGIGYYYVLASPVPLDYRRFEMGRGGADWSRTEQRVRGDPFRAVDELTRALLPDRRDISYASDYFDARRYRGDRRDSPREWEGRSRRKRFP